LRGWRVKADQVNTRRINSVLRVNKHGNFQFAIKRCKHLHQTVQREASKMGVSDARKIRCGESSHGGGLSHRQPALVQRRDDAGGKDRLGVFDIRFRVGEIAIDIAASFDQFKFGLVYDSNSRFSRAAIRTLVSRRIFKARGRGPRCRPRGLAEACARTRQEICWNTSSSVSQPRASAKGAKPRRMSSKRAPPVAAATLPWRIRSWLCPFALHTGGIGIRAVNLEDLPCDPADRLIVATALEGYRLLTADLRILE